MNPKLQAIKASGLVDLDEMPSISVLQIEPVSSPAADEALAPMQPVADSAELSKQQMATALENRIRDIEGRIRNLPLDQQQQYMQDLQSARGFARDGLPADLASLDGVDRDLTKKEGEKIQDVGMALAAGIPLGLSFISSGELPHLESILTPAHPKIAQEIHILSGHGVPKSGQLADPFDLGVLQVPAGLPAISKQIQMQRNTGFVRDITNNS